MMEFIKIPPHRFNDVIEHLRETFFADEPLNKSLQLCERGVGHPLTEKYCLKTLSDGLSVMAVTADQEIAGVALNGVLVDGDVEKAFENLQCIDDEKFKKIFSFLYSHNLEVNLFEQFDVDRIFELRILSVNSKYRGQGIARQLVVKSEKIAEENGFKLIKSDATSFITYKICAPLGFVVCSEKRFDEYLDANGEQIFHTESPHESNKIVCKLLDHEHVTSF